MGILGSLFGHRDKNVSESPKTMKENLEDFFKIDLNHIMDYEPSFSHTRTNAFGREVRYYHLILEELELGLFSELEILEVKEGEYNITFKGKYNLLTKELVDFLNFYTDKYGLDEMGCGGIEQSDYHYIDSHLFSRMWKNLMIDNNSFNSSNGNMEMCIMGIKNVHL